MISSISPHLHLPSRMDFQSAAQIVGRWVIRLWRTQGTVHEEFPVEVFFLRACPAKVALDLEASNYRDSGITRPEQQRGNFAHYTVEEN